MGGGKAVAYTRSGLDWSDRFAPIVEAAAGLPVESALIDGEVVTLDAQGRPSFQALQAALKENRNALSFFAFDLLEQDGEDLSGLGNLDRKDRLSVLLEGAAPPLHLAEHVGGNGGGVVVGRCREGWEGGVAKRLDAPYRGRRSQSWLKIKCIQRQEFVIIGWTESDKGRGFRSLLLGLNDADGLRYAGKVGTGFNAAGIEALSQRMKRLERKTAPVRDAPRAATRGAHWLKPELVAEIAFTEFTGDGVLRHPSFLGLREDKPAGQVKAERAAPVAAVAELPVRISNPDRII